MLGVEGLRFLNSGVLGSLGTTSSLRHTWMDGSFSVEGLGDPAFRAWGFGCCQHRHMHDLLSAEVALLSK